MVLPAESENGWDLYQKPSFANPLIYIPSSAPHIQSCHCSDSAGGGGGSQHPGSFLKPAITDSEFSHQVSLLSSDHDSLPVEAVNAAPATQGAEDLIWGSNQEVCMAVHSI